MIPSGAIIDRPRRAPRAAISAGRQASVSGARKQDPPPPRKPMPASSGHRPASRSAKAGTLLRASPSEIALVSQLARAFPQPTRHKRQQPRLLCSSLEGHKCMIGHQIAASAGDAGASVPLVEKRLVHEGEPAPPGEPKIEVRVLEHANGWIEAAAGLEHASSYQGRRRNDGGVVEEICLRQVSGLRSGRAPLRAVPPSSVVIRKGK